MTGQIDDLVKAGAQLQARKEQQQAAARQLAASLAPDRLPPGGEPREHEHAQAGQK